MSNKTVALDFNGVCDQYMGFVKGGNGTEYPPREHLEDFLKSLKMMRFDVVVFTVIDTDAIWDWLWKHNLSSYITDVTNTKPPAIAYIDDRAINFNGNFKDALNSLKDFKAHWE